MNKLALKGIEVVALIKMLPVAVGLLLLSGISPVDAAQKLVLGVENVHYYPLYDSDDAGYKGFAKEFFDRFASEKGYELEYRILPVNRLFQEFLTDQTIDIKFPDSPDWKSDLKKGAKVTYSDGIVEYIDGIMTTPDHKNDDVGQLKSLATVMGYTPFAALDLISAGQVVLTEVPDFSTLIKQGMYGRYNGIYANVAVVSFNLKYELKQANGLVFNSNWPYIRDKYQASSIKYPQVMKELSQFMIDKADWFNALKIKFEVAPD